MPVAFLFGSEPRSLEGFAMSNTGTAVQNLLARQHDFLSFKQIEEQYPGAPKAATLYIWSCTKRYGFDQLITKMGRHSRIRRDRWEKFLDDRTASSSIGPQQAAA